MEKLINWLREIAGYKHHKYRCEKNTESNKSWTNKPEKKIIQQE